MVHARGGLGLAGEALVVDGVLGEVAAQALEHDLAVERRLAREVHHTHPALGDLVVDLVARDLARRFLHVASRSCP